MKNIKTIVISATAFIQSLGVFIPCNAETFTFPRWSNSTQSIEFTRSDGYLKYITSFLGGSQLLVEAEEQREGNFIKFLSFVPASGEPVAEPSTEYKRRQSPDNGPGESDKRGVGIKKQHVFTQSEILQILMWGPLSTLLMFPLGVYFSLYIRPAILEKRRRWMKYHDLKKKRFEQEHPEQHYQRPAKTFCQRIWF
jgi:hypothetical protein